MKFEFIDKKWKSPVSKIQWKSGRSAMECARYFTDEHNIENKHPEEILLTKEINAKRQLEEAILSVDKNINFLSSQVEYLPKVTGFGSGSWRHHDVFLFNENRSIVIGIEAKADETFDKNILKKKFDSENSKMRLRKMCTKVFGTEENCFNIDLMYQLLTGTVGTMEEVVDEGTGCFLIMSFLKHGCYKQKNIDNNLVEIVKFEKLINRYKINDYYILPGYPNKKFYLKHIEIKL